MIKVTQNCKKKKEGSKFTHFWKKKRTSTDHKWPGS
jgi:hypothetical protein